MISSDQCRSVEGNLRNTLNAVGTSVMRAEGFYGAFKKCRLWPSMKTRLNHKLNRLKVSLLVVFRNQLLSVSIV